MMQSLVVIDISVVLGMLVLADLSARLGEAMKVPPYYRVLYVTAALVFVSFGIDSFRESLNLPVLDTITVAVRALSCVVAFLACLPYWRWLFSEFFHPQR